MFLGRVIGNVVCTVKNPSLEGQRLLIVQPLDRHGRDKGRPLGGSRFRWRGCRRDDLLVPRPRSGAWPSPLARFPPRPPSSASWIASIFPARQFGKLLADPPEGTRSSEMLIGRVIGDVVATQKAPSHEGRKILVVQPLNLDGSDRGEPLLALDAVDAGFGDRVLLTVEGFSAMTAVGRPNSPIDAAVIGVIDAVELVQDRP